MICTGVLGRAWAWAWAWAWALGTGRREGRMQLTCCFRSNHSVGWSTVVSISFEIRRVEIHYITKCVRHLSVDKNTYVINPRYFRYQPTSAVWVCVSACVCVNTSVNLYRYRTRHAQDRNRLRIESSVDTGTVSSEGIARLAILRPICASACRLGTVQRPLLARYSALRHVSTRYMIGRHLLVWPPADAHRLDT